MITEEILNKIKSGARVRVFERIPAYITSATAKEKDKSKKYEDKAQKGGERLSSFEGIVLARKHGKEAGATFTVRAIVAGVGTEKVYPIHSPLLTKIEIISSPKKVSRAKLYYLRDVSVKQTRKKLGGE